MISEGFWVDGPFDPGAVVEVLGPRVHRGCSGSRVTVTVATTLSPCCSGPGGVPAAPALVPRAAGCCAALLVPFVLPTVVVAWRFRELIGEAGPSGSSGLTGRRRDRRRPGLLQRLGGDPCGRRRVGVPRPTAWPRRRPRAGRGPWQVTLFRTVTSRVAACGVRRRASSSVRAACATASVWRLEIATSTTNRPTLRRTARPVDRVPRCCW